MNKAKRIEIFSRFREANPNPETELNYSSPFELLIAVILSAQATDVGVNKATDKLYPVANTPEAILALGVDGLKNYIKTIGLFNSKAENVIKTCRILIEKHNSIVPDNREDLEALPGVGRKTANVVLNTAFGHSYFPGIQPHRHRSGQERCGSRKSPDAAGAERVSSGCSSLAYPARALHLRSAQTPVRCLHY